MRLSTWTATSISVARRSSVCERSPSPITRLNRPMVASARARFVYPDALCQAILPFSAISSRLAVALGRRSLGGRAGHGGRARGYDDGRLRIALGDAGVDAVLIVRPVAGK